MNALVKPEPAVGQVWAFPPDYHDLPNFTFAILGKQVKQLEPPEGLSNVGSLPEGMSLDWVRQQVLYTTTPLGPRGGVCGIAFPPEFIKECTYLGTLDELRARATAGDLLYTDNSAVVAKLSAENERLRAALKKIVSIRMAAGDQPSPTIDVCLHALNPEYKGSAVEGDAA